MEQLATKAAAAGTPTFSYSETLSKADYLITDETLEAFDLVSRGCTARTTMASASAFFHRAAPRSTSPATILGTDHVFGIWAYQGSALSESRGRSRGPAAWADSGSLRESRHQGDFLEEAFSRRTLGGGTAWTFMLTPPAARQRQGLLRHHRRPESSASMPRTERRCGRRKSANRWSSNSPYRKAGSTYRPLPEAYSPWKQATPRMTAGICGERRLRIMARVEMFASRCSGHMTEASSCRFDASVCRTCVGPEQVLIDVSLRLQKVRSWPESGRWIFEQSYTL